MMIRSLILSVMTLVALPLSSLSWTAPPDESPEQEDASGFFQGKSFSLYVLSRGRGVPDAAREVLGQVRDMLAARKADGIQVRVQEDRIGLEGERRLCAEFDSETDAREAWRTASEIAMGVELVNLEQGLCTR